MEQNPNRPNHCGGLTERQTQRIIAWTPEFFLLVMLLGEVVCVSNAVLGGRTQIAYAGLLTVFWAAAQAVMFLVMLKKLRKKVPHLLRWVSSVQCGLSAILFFIALFYVLNAENQTALVSVGGAAVCAVVCTMDCWSKYGD